MDIPMTPKSEGRAAEEVAKEISRAILSEAFGSRMPTQEIKVMADRLIAQALREFAEQEVKKAEIAVWMKVAAQPSEYWRGRLEAMKQAAEVAFGYAKSIGCPEGSIQDTIGLAITAKITALLSSSRQDTAGCLSCSYDNRKVYKYCDECQKKETRRPGV